MPAAIMNSDFIQQFYISYMIFHMTPMQLANENGRGISVVVGGLGSFCLVVVQLLRPQRPFLCSQYLIRIQVKREFRKPCRRLQEPGHLVQATLWPHLTVRGLEMLSFMPSRVWQVHAKASVRITF
jgi:hypothetical protein